VTIVVKLHSCFYHKNIKNILLQSKVELPPIPHVNGFKKIVLLSLLTQTLAASKRGTGEKGLLPKV
jgi:hypothetical protein